MPKINDLFQPDSNETRNSKNRHKRQNKRRKLIASSRSRRKHRSEGSFKKRSTAHRRQNKPYPLNRCDEKIHFEHKRDATKSADSYMERVSITFDPMVPYYCSHHSMWHTGHDTRFPEAQRAGYRAKCVERERIRKGRQNP